MAGKIIPFPNQKRDREEFVTVTVGEKEFKIRKEYQGQFLSLVESLLQHLERKSAGSM